MILGNYLGTCSTLWDPGATTGLSGVPLGGSDGI